MKPSVVVLALLALPLAAFSWQRQVLPGTAGPQRLEVDLALLGATRAGLADLRLNDAAGRELPYVLVPPAREEAAWIRARQLPLSPTRTSSGLELDLGSAQRTSRLRLEGLRPPFLKRFQLEGSGDRQRWTQLVAQGSLFDLPGEGLRLLTVEFPEGEYRYLRLVWDDRSSARVAMPRGAWAALAGPGHPRPVLAPLEFQRRPSEPGVSRFALRLPGPGIPVRALVLDVAGSGPILREARVAEPRLQAGGLAPRALGQARLRRAQQGDASAADLRIPMEAPSGTELDIRVEDGSNPALALTGVQAELAPQPWIYFESRDGGPVAAMCGDPRLGPPRYDLEALRDELDPGRTAAARWGPALAPPAAEAPAGLDGGPGAMLEGGFRFRRPVPPGTPGLTALALDAHVLAHSPNLWDLRLLDPERRQIPYLLERRDEPLSLELALPQGQPKGRATLYALALPQAGLPASRLVLETDARVFTRRLRLLEDADGATRQLAAADWTHQDPETPAPPLVVTLPAVAAAQVTLELDEGDNRPLPLKAARLLLPGWRLRFFQPQGPLELCYGLALGPPQYDLALLAERLRDAPAREAALGPEGREGPDRGLVGPRLFWGVLAVAVVGLLAILARLLKSQTQE
jgi:hypothetical protein